MKPLHNKIIPAMLESLTTYNWDCNDFLKYRYAVQPIDLVFHSIGIFPEG